MARDADAPLLLVVSLWLADGDVAGFEAFERRAAAAMARHGGRIVQAVRIAAAGAPADAPFEVHVVIFPDRAAFDAYRSDPETAALAPQRAAVIARTTVLSGSGVAYDVTV